MNRIKKFIPLSIIVLCIVFQNLWTTDIEMNFLQGEIDSKITKSQEGYIVYSEDTEVMNLILSKNPSRFTLKTYEEEELISSLRAKEVFHENIAGKTITYYFSPVLESYVLVKGEKVNLQKSKNGNEFTFGYPLIDTSF